MPVVSLVGAEVLRAVAPLDVQLFEAHVEGEQLPFFILNALKRCECIDEGASAEVQRWLPEDNRPDLLGQYKSVIGLRVKPALIGPARVFRPAGWEVALIVSEEVKKAMERAGLVRPKFLPAS